MLTDVALKKVKPSDKVVRLWDEKGLYLEVNPTGGKWWRLKFRVDGKEKRLSLGTYPEVGLKDARDKRDKMREQLRDGIDPGQSRKASKVAEVEDGFEAVAREWWAKFSPSWKSEKYRAVTLRRMELNLFPWLGKRPVGELKASELLATLRRVEGRGAVDTTHRLLSLCGQVFRFAVATNRAKRDPSADLKDAISPRTVKHFSATTEPKRLAEILRALDGYSGSMVTRCALRIAPLVFVRPGELRHAKWADIDLDAAEWRYLVTKTDTPHIVPLSKQAVAILREVHPVTGRGVWVFPSNRTSTRPMSDNTVLAAMRRLDIGKDEMTGHGFRAVARTILDEVLGFRPDWIEHQLAHTVKDPNGRAYNRTAHLESRRKMMQKWADYLDKIKQREQA